MLLILVEVLFHGGGERSDFDVTVAVVVID
jgi:hypothetical protein